MRRFVSRLTLGLSLVVLSAIPQVAHAEVIAGAAVNAASFTRQEFPNGKLAQGVMFTVFGQGMGPAELIKAGAFPLPTELGGTSVRVTVNGTMVDCIMLFTRESQVAAILPSRTPVGAGTLTVTYNGAISPPLAIVVVAHSFGIFTDTANGRGQGSVADPLAPVRRMNGFFQSANPGELWDIWGSGLGAAPGDESMGPGPGDLTHINVEVYVGGKLAQVVYRGRSGCCSGLDQIRIIIPEGVAGCSVSIVVVIDGVPSNFATIAIDPIGNVCSDPNGPSAMDLANLQTNGVVSFGQVLLGRTWSEILAPGQMVTVERGDSAAAVFMGLDLAQSNQLASAVPAVGSCVVTPLPGVSVTPGPALDAGTVTLSRGGAMYNLNQIIPGQHLVLFGPNLPAGPGVVNDGTMVDAGLYTFKALGGGDVGGFEVSIAVPAPLDWTNREQIQTVSLNQPLTITWSNPAPGAIVQIFGFSPSSLGSEGLIGAQFYCRARAEAGTFTVPAWVTGSLPPSIEIGGLPGGTLNVGLYAFGDRFSASGLDYGLIWYADSFVKKVTFQ